jgi:hypothetical protein
LPLHTRGLWGDTPCKFDFVGSYPTLIFICRILALTVCSQDPTSGPDGGAAPYKIPLVWGTSPQTPIVGRQSRRLPTAPWEARFASVITDPASIRLYFFTSRRYFPPSYPSLVISFQVVCIWEFGGRTRGHIKHTEWHCHTTCKHNPSGMYMHPCVCACIMCIEHALSSARLHVMRPTQHVDHNCRHIPGWIVSDALHIQHLHASFVIRRVEICNTPLDT